MLVGSKHSEKTKKKNGITLSKKAHDKFHKKYGGKSNTLEQILEFVEPIKK